MTRHCATCDCPDDGPRPPATSTAWAREQARQAAADAVAAARARRTTRDAFAPRHQEPTP